jgi:predicted amidohydrolase YtcJ
MSCHLQTVADLVIIDADIFDPEGVYPKARAIAIKDGIIISIGSNEAINELVGIDTEVIHANGNFLMPGLIEGHAHLIALGESLIQLNLIQTDRWETVLDSVKMRLQNLPPGEALIGRGWHQEKWLDADDQWIQGYPHHAALSNISPDHPVILLHASNHTLMANEQAMNLLGINTQSAEPDGGRIIKDEGGNLTGIFDENAMKPFLDYINALKEGEGADNYRRKCIRLAMDHCLSLGITTFIDAMSTHEENLLFKSMAENEELDIRLHSMLYNKDIQFTRDVIDQYPMLNIGNGYFNCRSLKGFMDGALGSFGAWFTLPYSDNPDESGQNLMPVDTLHALAVLARDRDMQMCIHAIGDRANREVLDIYEDVIGRDRDAHARRWRIEHAQHLHASDIPRFADQGVLAAIQSIHCVSDAPYVERRLGAERSKEGAYVWRKLADFGTVLINGTDAPIEAVDPFSNLHAAVTRLRLDGNGAFYPDQALTRNEAINSYTKSGAFSVFEENLTGTIAINYRADLTIVDTNLLTCSDEELKSARAMYTLVDGKIKYKR